MALAACATPQEAAGPAAPFAGMIAADEPRAALVGQEVLSNGGSAADAAVATYFTLAVAMPSSAGIGGGGVCLVHDPDKKTVEALDFLPAPSLAAGRPGLRVAGAVPGAPRGMYALHARFGRLRWETLLVPAENLARFGGPVSRALAAEIAGAGEAVLADAELRRLFAGLREGTRFAQPELAATLSRLRTRGPGDFHAGQFAAQLVAAAEAVGAPLTADDLRLYAPQWRPTVQVPLGNETAHFPPPPALGGVVAGQMLAMLADDRLFAGTRPEARAHLLAEVSARSYADRGVWMRSTAAMAQPAELVALQRTRALMSDYRKDGHAASRAGWAAPAEPTGGAGFVALDADGLAVACALTMNRPFGSGRMAPGTGVILAAAPEGAGIGADALAASVVANRHTGTVLFAAAAAGGASAPGALAAVAASSLLERRPLAAALGAPRVHHAGAPDLTLVESAAEGGELARRGHAVREMMLPARVNAVRCQPARPSATTCEVASDPRGGGFGAVAGKE